MDNPLKPYVKKRDLKKTPEPLGVVKKRAHDLLEFVIQKHRASRLHYDFHLECDGVLLSWAVPKGPSTNPREKRLAVMVEDHPFDYRCFEGIIPAGQYGAGTVIVWDKGTYYPIDYESIDDCENPGQTNLADAQRIVRDGIRKGKLSFVLKGKKLQGEWTLVRLKNNPKQWLLVKHDDKYADEVDLTRLDKSVLSRKTLEQLM